MIYNIHTTLEFNHLFTIYSPMKMKLHPQTCLFLWMIIHLFFISTHFVATRGNSINIRCKEPERKAMFKIRQFLELHLDSWVSEDCCTWLGVRCDNVTHNIISFDAIVRRDILNSYGFRKPVSLNTIISALLELKYLTYLDLSGINLESPIPHLIGSMIQLKHLSLSDNSIYGDVPPQLGNLTKLEVLDLSNTFMSGDVPHQLGNLTKLEVLNLFYTGLSIESLGWASSLSNLQFIDISDNQLSQTVNLDQLPSVSHLSLSNCDCDIYNILSHSFVNKSVILSSLKYFDLSSNSLESPLTPNLGNLSSLIFLDLSFNSLNGSVPSWISELKNLQGLNVKYNSFSHIEGGIWGFMNNLCHFEHLDLSYNNFQGEISKSHVNTSNCKSYKLDFLDIRYNQITGTLPSFIGHFKLLKVLDLSFNPIQGTILLTHIGGLSNLSYLDTSYTNLSLNLLSNWNPPFQLSTFRAISCKIVNPPNWLHTQASIEKLDLSSAGMSGEPRYWISNMTNLYSLNLSNNFLTGTLPQQFASQNLEYLDMNTNDLSGTFPDWLFSLEKLRYMDLSSNRFSGSIPQSIGKRCRLQFLQLKNNSLEGIIPQSLDNCIGLVILNLGYNNLSGYIPPWASNDLPNLVVLELQGNQLGKDKNSTIPESLCSLEELKVLDLHQNELSGSIPDCWQNTSSMKMINLSSNKLSGVIPCSLGKLTLLEYLHLNDNELQGEIPSCLSGANYLTTLDFGGNKLIGLVPSWLKGETFFQLNILRLSNNFLNGTIPNELCSLPLLRVLDLSSNQLVGNIPKCFGNLNGINEPPGNTTVELFNFDSVFYKAQVDFTLVELVRENSVNETIGGFERQYSTVLKFFTTIDLSDNNLNGTIPEQLTNLSGLIALRLARNHLTGNIPKKIGDMEALETLDLSMNNFCGTIPPSLGNLDSLNAINFSFNNLSGPIPTNRHIDTLSDASVYEGNPYLCADFLPKKCSSHVEPPTIPKVQDENEKEDKHEKLWFYLTVMLGFGSGFWGIVGTLWLNRSWRHSLFGRVEDLYDWLYVCFALKMPKLKKWMRKENSEE